ncbi:MAG: monovalent cation/H(+) antiporter subunit G [Pseudomonadota bacterium]
MNVHDIIVGVMVVIGSGFILIAAIGLIRLQDVYLRMHAASKAGTLGSGVMLIALAVYALETDVITRAVAGVVFLILTAPVSAHLLARASFMSGYKPCDETKIDTFSKSLNLDAQKD